MDMETTQSVEEDKFEEYVRVILADSMINHKIKKVIEDGDIPFEDIPMGVKQGHDFGDQYVSPDFKNVVINYDGYLIGYCKQCDEFLLYTEMAADKTRPHAITTFCKKCANARKKEQPAYQSSYGNGKTRGSNNRSQVESFSPSTEDIDKYIGTVNKLWNDAPSTSLEDMNKMPGLNTKHFIYISKCYTPDDEKMKNIRNTLNKPHLDKLVYIGQTNGNNPSYEGSGSALDTLKNQYGIDMKHDGETKVIDVVESDKVNICEREWILNTGIITIGLNISPGTGTAKRTIISFSLDPHSLEEIEIYENGIQMADARGVTNEQYWKKLWKHGYRCLVKKQDKQLDKFFKGG